MKFSCPHCGQHIEAPDEIAGIEIECPGCDRRIEVKDPKVKAKVTVGGLDFELIEDSLPPSPPLSSDAIQIIIAVILFFATAVVLTPDMNLEKFQPGQFLLAFFCVAGLITYFIPSLIAHRRKHRNLTALVALNFFAGWTILGWVGALVWALYKEREK